MTPLYVPPELEPFRALDKTIYALGRPNLWDPDQAVPPDHEASQPRQGVCPGPQTPLVYLPDLMRSN